MGLLDDLARQAEQKQAGEEERRKQREERERRFRTETRPAMSRLYDYLNELCELLNYLARETRVQYEIPRYGQLEARVVPDYRLRVSRDSGRVRIEINLDADVVDDSAPVVRYDKRSILEDVESYVQERGLRAEISQKTRGDDELLYADLRVHGRIRMRGVIEGEADSERVDFSFTNFDRFGTTSKQVAVSSIDEAFFDQLGRYLAREDDTYLREAIDESLLADIRQRLRQDAQRRTSELRIADSLAREERERREAQQDRSMLGRLRRLTERLKGSS